MQQKARGAAARADERQLRRVEDEADHAGLLKRVRRSPSSADRRRATPGAATHGVLRGVHADAAVLNNIRPEDRVVVLVHVRMSEQNERQAIAPAAATRVEVVCDAGLPPRTPRGRRASARRPADGCGRVILCVYCIIHMSAEGCVVSPARSASAAQQPARHRVEDRVREEEAPTTWMSGWRAGAARRARWRLSRTGRDGVRPRAGATAPSPVSFSAPAAVRSPSTSPQRATPSPPGRRLARAVEQDPKDRGAAAGGGGEEHHDHAEELRGQLYDHLRHWRRVRGPRRPILRRRRTACWAGEGGRRRRATPR